MLRPVSELLAGRTVVLASGSPRRRQILENIQFPHEVVPSRFEENLNPSHFSEPWQYAVENARRKAQEVALRIKDRQDWAVVTGADTIVVLDGDILGKPGSNERAREMLQRLSGHTHLVYTGMTLLYRKEVGGALQEHSFHEATEVTFAPLSVDVLQAYVDSGEPLDKAGGYGIQGLGATLVEGVKGDYFNVVGLPLHRLCVELLTVLGQRWQLLASEDGRLLEHT